MKNKEIKNSHPFIIKNCMLTTIATGEKAESLRELRDKLMDIHPGSVYYHFWGGLLSPRFEEPEFNNDFAAWAYRALRDPVLAERLAMIDPTPFADIEDLRQEVIEVIEERLYETEIVPVVKPDEAFCFIRSQIVIFDTYRRLIEPKELASVVPTLSGGSIFYHFIDARRRTDERIDDFRAWLKGFGNTYNDLCDMLAAVDPYFTTLVELRKTLSKIFKTYFGEDEKA
ncbi:MAG: hypothetical protein B5M53_03645 [Candidatus Cloacimonas sp. 4484_209]|nr:hypothetical protein [Deltaproteobacteria bacterium]OQX55869.1 MAG: hypothetical protein B5M53_03645 [Candidatus Cloacimonas sp. 4484_209]